MKNTSLLYTDFSSAERKSKIFNPSLYSSAPATMPLSTAQAASEQDIKDIVVLTPQESIWGLVIWMIIAAVVLAAIVWLVYSLIKRAGHRAVETSPGTVAVRALQKLEQETKDMDPNAFGLELSETVKNYLAAKFNDPIRYETAGEFLSRFANSSIPVTSLPTSVHQNLRDFVSSSEEIKFARTADARSKMEPLLKLATDIIRLIETVNQDEQKKQEDSFI